ncbi:MAG TPA: carboxylesterase family protein [Kofleriaceae bacterium]|nr:carboxylesterase family protein [Kofleriaceae bacterium]
MRTRLLCILALASCAGPDRASAPAAASATATPAATATATATAASAPAASRTSSSRPTAETREGRVLGKLDGDGVAAFLGVPYAAPPVAGDRWREALPPRPHPPLEATAFRLPCSQIPLPQAGDRFSTGKKIPSSEDCLHLNVWVPPRAAGEKLPVMAWLHGGQYLRGAASQYDGAQLARTGHVIVVTMDYRLGPLGFLAHPALTRESPRHTSGNEALFDSLQALVWLRANIAAFGGDPGRLTLFGESAGSASTCALLASPLARGLFQRAILESDACPGAEDTPSLASREEFGRRLADALGCKSSDLGRELACMRSKTADQVLTAIPLAKVLGDDGNGVGYRFNKDNVVLSESPEEALKAGRIMRVPVMLGTTDDEMGRYVVGLDIHSADDFRARIAKEWPEHARLLVDTYPVSHDVGDQVAALYSDWGMTCPVRRDARWFSSAGVPTYLYRFTHAPNVMGGKAGAFHGSELVYLFPSVFARPDLQLVYGDQDRALARLMIGYWARFAATGDPNGEGALAWPRYTSATDRHMTIDLAPSIGHHLRGAQCDTWDRVGD